MTTLEPTAVRDAGSPETRTRNSTRAGGTGGRILAISLNTFRETVRDRVLYNLILFVMLLVACSIFVSDLSIAVEAKFTAELGLSAMLVFGALIAIFIGVGLVFKEIERRTIYNLLSKPVHRHEFIVGKYFGLCLTLLVNSAAMIMATEIALWAVKGAHRDVQSAVLVSGFLIYLELCLIVAVALFFSSFTTPMLAALFSFAIYVIGQFSADLLQAALIAGSQFTRSILHALYYLLPNFSKFNYITEAAHGRIVSAGLITMSTLYAIVYTCVLVCAAIGVFQKRSFK
jgi:ABC-type transport system involved in multi-copper enzyme maturation permease subunit